MCVVGACGMEGLWEKVGVGLPACPCTIYRGVVCYLLQPIFFSSGYLALIWLSCSYLVILLLRPYYTMHWVCNLVKFVSKT